jgi:transcription termination/antitermination protein NusG
MSNVENNLKWYAVHARTGSEKKVIERLRWEAKRNNLEKFFGEVILPVEDVVEMRGGQRRKSERKFFPGYLLVQMDLNDDTWYLVKNISDVIGFIGGQAPAPVSQKEIDAIRERMKEGVSKPKPKVLFEPGEVVRVVEGPFADFNAVVEDVNYEKSRLRVSVLIFGRSTPVELEFGQVRKA